MKGDKNDILSVENCRRWLKRLERSKQYNYITSILVMLIGAVPPWIGERAIAIVKELCKVLNICCGLNMGGNQCYYPYYIDRMFDMILEGEQWRELDYIHLQRKIRKTREKCDKEWEKIMRNLEI